MPRARQGTLGALPATRPLLPLLSRKWTVKVWVCPSKTAPKDLK